MLPTEKDNTALLLLRGRAYAEQGRWPQAVADFRAASQAQPKDARARRDLGLALLASGDEPASRRICTDMLRDFGETQHAETAKAVLSLAVLLPGAVPEPKALLPLSDKACPARPAHAEALTLLGAALYRAGTFDEALHQLERARDVPGEGISVEAELFLAMVQQHLRHTDLAQTALTVANDHWLRALARHPSWDEELRWQRLRQEAEKLLQETNP
jgi:tetratricopeptide (TPR) repeat protein